MNELEKYKQYQSDKDTVNKHEYDGWKRGFDAAIALDLPVKFGIFYSEKCTRINNSYHLYQGNSYTMNQLYQYWIENIFKINE